MEQFIQYLNILTATQWFMLPVIVVLFMSLLAFKQQRKLQNEQKILVDSLQRDLRALANAAVGVGGRVMEIERQQRKRPQVVVSQEQTSQHQQHNMNHVPVELYSSSSQPYEQAINMAQSGATTDDIVNVCGLSKSEAELVNMMHRLDKAC